MSYVIFKGTVLPGADVDKEQIVEKEAALASYDTNLMNTVFEAFARVMLRLAFAYNFRKNIIIYSDSKSACDIWEKVDVLKYLSGLFENVNIEYIPRKFNALADKAGRDIEFMKMDKHRFEDYMLKCNDREEGYEEYSDFKKRFALSAVNVSNLFEELKLISEEIRKKELRDEL